MEKLTPKLIKRMGSFKSYIGLEEYGLRKMSISDGTLEEPVLWPGEIVVAYATEVNLLTSLSRNSGVPGSIYVTNGRIIFRSMVQGWEEYYVPLLAVHTMYYYEDEKRRGRHKLKLVSGKGSKSQSQPLSGRGSARIYEILVTCSNFSTFNISFKLSKIDQGINVFNAILKFSKPDSIKKLYYFSFSKLKNYDSDSANSSHHRIVPYMDVEMDWSSELKKCRVSRSKYRVSDMNRNYQVCDTLPQWIVVAADIPDSKTEMLSEKLKGCRPPTWVWGNESDSAIFRMGSLQTQNQTDIDAENSYFEKLRKSIGNMRAARLEDIELILPPKEIKTSFNRLLELCCPESMALYEESDVKFLSNLENSKWLFWISNALQKSYELAKFLTAQTEIVILRETESRHVTCIISSLIQLIVEPRFRTAQGFFALIQKEWIAMGHPFHETYSNTSYMFLLFLDCTHQLVEQNPFDFEFNDSFLGEIWDSTLDSTTGTFLFDNPKQRSDTETRRDLDIWHRMLNKVNSYVPKESDSFAVKRNAIASKVLPAQHGHPRALLNASPEVRLLPKYHNPWFKVKHLLNTSEPMSLMPTDQTLLRCSSCICDVVFWRNLYLKRTLYTSPLIRNAKASFISKGTDSVPSTPDSLFHMDLSPNSSTQSSSAESSSPCRRYRGRSTSTELQIIDNLIATLTNSNKYSNNFRSSSPQHKLAPVPPPKPGKAVRQNPFFATKM